MKLYYDPHQSVAEKCPQGVNKPNQYAIALIGGPTCTHQCEFFVHKTVTTTEETEEHHVECSHPDNGRAEEEAEVESEIERMTKVAFLGMQILSAESLGTNGGVKWENLESVSQTYLRKVAKIVLANPNLTGIGVHVILNNQHKELHALGFVETPVWQDREVWQRTRFSYFVNILRLEYQRDSA